ncbi:efflux RND transporter periplasmic adaptor subunit [Sphingobacterium anhuiense]|uniref:efflux RND transporter periplasmic adaptor subunit n=1 Tax=Sphingobacterium anhuiense TaxID=493780 RepID=UPI003C2F5C27
MKSNFLRILYTIGLFAYLTGCQSAAEETDKKVTKESPAIETFVLSKEKLTSKMQIPGEISGFQQVEIYAKVSSYVQALKVDIGSKVKAGQLLAVLEAPELSSQLSTAKSRLKSQEAIYTATKSTYDRLFETSKVEGTVARLDLEVAEAKKNADYAQFQAAKSAYAEVQNLLNYLEIRAPFDGVIATRNVNQGAYVGPAGRGSEMPIMTIQQQSKLRLAVSVPEQYAGFLVAEQPLQFTVKSLPGQYFTGKIARKSGALDSKLRSERIEIDINNTNNKLLPGMVAEVELPLTSQDSTFVVPKAAIYTSGEGSFVIAVIANKTSRVPVQKGRSIEEQVEIFGNLNPTMLLLSKADEEIADGTPVK